MKGCLKLTPMLNPGLDSQVQHLNGLHEHSGRTQCCHSPTTASSSSPTAPSSCTANTASATQSEPQTQIHRKCVAFCAKGSETVYTADEWDRTPAEPARKLSYQDLLELKEIQQSLPHADQPPDVATGRPGKQFLSGVPIVLLPLLSASGGDSQDANSAQESEAKKPSSAGYFSDGHGRTNGTHGNGVGWGPPSLTGFGRQAQSQPQRQTQGQTTPPSFPFPPRPVPFSAPASTSNFPSARAPAPPTASSPTQPWHMNFRSQNKTASSSSSSSPSSPTSPYPSSYSNRPSPTSTSTRPYSNLSPQQPPRNQSQSRTAWTPPHSLSHLMPSTPAKPREKPKFAFVTLLDNGGGTDNSSGPSSDGVDGEGNVEVARTTNVGTEVPLHPPSKLPSGLIGIEGEELERRNHHHDEHDLEDHDQDHDLVSVTSSSSCPSLCASSCPSSCSASEVDTDHEHEPEVEIEGQRHYFPKRFSGLDRYGHAVGSGAKSWGVGNVNVNGAAAKLLRPSDNLSFPSRSPVGFHLDDKVERGKTMKKKPEVKEKKRKFILVNDVEMELDDSESESEDGALSGSTTSTASNSTTRETTTTTTTKTTSGSSGSPSSPRSSIMAPVPTKSALGSSRLSPPPPTSSASLITPPNTPPSEPISRYGSHANNKQPLHSPTSPPSAMNRGRMKAIQKRNQGSISRERSGSMGSDNGSGGGGGRSSPSRSCTTVMRMGSPVKLKSKMS